jgi:hypothetical protein
LEQVLAEVATIGTRNLAGLASETDRSEIRRKRAVASGDNVPPGDRFGGSQAEENRDWGYRRVVRPRTWGVIRSGLRRFVVLFFIVLSARKVEIAGTAHVRMDCGWVRSRGISRTLSRGI